jgi:hypothetical protein
MRYGVVMANLKEYSDPRVAVRLAQAGRRLTGRPSSCGTTSASRGLPSSDPSWVILPTLAVSTTHLTLGTAITP